MSFKLDPQESQPDLLKRLATATTEELEETVATYDGTVGPVQNQVNQLKNELRKRRGKVEFRLSWETRIIAYTALVLTAIQTGLQLYELFFAGP